MSDNKRPVHEVTFYPVRISIWENESDDHRTFYSTTVVRLLRAKGQMAFNAFVERGNLLVAAKALDAADSWIREQFQASREEQLTRA